MEAAQPDVVRLLGLMADAVVSARSAFPVQDMLNALRYDKDGPIEDVILQNRLLPNDAQYSVEVGVKLVGFAQPVAVVVPSKQYAAHRASKADAAASEEKAAEPTTTSSPEELASWRSWLLYSIYGQPCWTPAALEQRLLKTIDGATPPRIDKDISQLLRWSVVIASICASARLRRLSMLDHLLNEYFSSRTRRLHLPKPICALQRSGGVFVVPNTAMCCRTFGSASEVLSRMTERACQRALVSEELFADASFPAFVTSSEEEFHTVSTLVVPMAEEAQALGCEVGLRYVPEVAVDEKKKTRGFVSAPPPPPPYAKYHMLVSADAHKASATITDAHKLGVRRRCRFLLVDSVAALNKIARDASGVVPIVDPYAGHWEISALLECLQGLCNDQVTYGLFLVEDHCGSCVDSTAHEWLSALAVAFGASYVWLAPPRGAHRTALYNEFLRLEETIVDRQGSCYLFVD